MLDDGTELPADVVVFATGYNSMNGWVADLIDAETADRLGKCWGLGSDTTKDPGPWEGEQRNMWKPTQVPNLWMHGGNLHQSRHYSQFLALQLKARFEGLETPVYALGRGPPHVMSDLMKAARFHGRGDIRIDEVPEPATRPGTVKVEVEWCGICGTDLHEFLEGPIFAPTTEAPHPLTGESIPVTLGHEFAGVVVETGDGVDDVRPGDRVVVEPYIVCGRCDACQQGKYNVCATLGFVGLSGGGGGFSKYVVAERRWIHPLGELGTDVGALVEPLAVAYHAVRLSGAQPSHSALVFGAGPIGLVTTASLKAVGVEEVVVVEPAGVRKEKASPRAPTTCSTRARSTSSRRSTRSRAGAGPTCPSSAPGSTRCWRPRSAPPGRAGRA